MRSIDVVPKPRRCDPGRLGRRVRDGWNVDCGIRSDLHPDRPIRRRDHGHDWVRRHRIAIVDQHSANFNGLQHLHGVATGRRQERQIAAVVRNEVVRSRCRGWKDELVRR